MGSSTKQQVQKTDPWGPSQQDRTNIMANARNLYSSLQGPQAPNQNDFYNTSYSGTGWEPVYQGNATGTVMTGYRPVGQQSSRTFDASRYNQALLDYNKAKQSWEDPTIGAMRDYQAALKMSGEYYDPLMKNANTELDRTIRGEYLDGNPHIDTMIGNTLANVNAQFSGAGRYGSGSHQGYLANSANQLRFANYDSERGRQMQALGMAPSQYSQFSELGLRPYATNVGLQQDIENTPWSRLAKYADIVNTVGGQGGQVSSPLYQNKSAGMMAGALAGGLGAYSLATPAFAAANPWLIPAAAIGGGLLGGNVFG